jgi:nicotinamide-nucleotide amidase
MKAVVMSIGSELLGGFLTDTNATFLAQDMSAAGIELVGVMQVGDDLDRIVHTLRRAAEDAELTVISGGVGPTEDDLTREAIAEYLGETVHVDPDLLQVVERFFASRRVPMPSRNEKQAWLIPSAEALPNPVGTAPGWFVRHGDQVIVSMPGVPREMRRMWREQVLPRLSERLGSTAIVSTTVKTIGIGESAAEDMVAEIIHRGNPVVATYAKNDGVHIRITASESDLASAQQLVRDTEREIVEIFGPNAYGSLDTRLGEAILMHCQRIGLPIRVFESGSAGRITNLLSEETDLAEWFEGGTVETFEKTCARLEIDPERDDSPCEVARSLSTSTGNQSRTEKITFAIVARIGEPLDGERRTGQIEYCLSIKDEMSRRSHTVQANPEEIRRRAALWASEFLHVSLVTHAGSRGAGSQPIEN